MEQSKAKKIVSIVSNVLLYLFLAICALAVILTVFSKKDSDGAAELFGYQMRVITSDSMAACELTDVSAYKIKSIPLRSMIFVKVMPEEEAEADAWYKSLQVGDVLTFRYVYTSQVTITHRITSITEKPTGGYIIQLAGDNKNSETEQLVQVIDTSVANNPNYVIGKVTGQAFLLGFLISLLKTPVGIVLIVIVPCFIIVLLEVLKIAGVLSADRKKREQEEKARKEDELAELRRRLTELEAQKAAPAPAPATVEPTAAPAAPTTEPTAAPAAPTAEPTAAPAAPITEPTAEPAAPITEPTAGAAEPAAAEKEDAPC